MSEMTVEVWSDVVCPWCCIGKAHLEAALAAFEHSADVDVVWRSYELDRDAPAIQEQTTVELLGSKYGAGPEQVAAMLENVSERARAAGLDLHLTATRSGNTFHAHRLLHLAKSRGLQDELKSRLFRAYFTEEQSIGDPDVLARVAVEAGLDEAEVRSVLTTDQFADDVLADEAMAREMQVTGVPFFVFDGRLAASGAQPAEVLLGALEQAWASRPDYLST